MRRAHSFVCLLAMALFAAMLACGLSACAQSKQAEQSSQASQESQSGRSTSAAAKSTAQEPAYELVDQPVFHDSSTGFTYIDMTIEDFNKLGFAYGDSVNVSFSNGYSAKGIPYYTGYYIFGVPFLVADSKSKYVEITLNSDEEFWKKAGLADGDTVTVTLEEQGATINTQLAGDNVYTDSRSDFVSDAVFANFRPLSGGNIKKNVFYRSATPVSNVRNRAAYVNTMMAEVGIGFVLDLSDTNAEVEAYLAENKEQGVNTSYFEDLYNRGKVKAIDLTAGYPDADFKRSLVDGLKTMTEHDGPYLIHCIEGKDRTGFVCMLLEILAGASYREIVSDYMLTYSNYYGVSLAKDPTKYNAIKDQRIDEMLRYIGSVDKGADLSSADFVGGVRKYLRDGGMTDAQIDALIAFLIE